MSRHLTEQAQALHDELTVSLSVFQGRTYQGADFLTNEFFTKVNTLKERGLLDEEEADRLRQACEDRVRNVFMMYDQRHAAEEEGSEE